VTGRAEVGLLAALVLGCGAGDTPGGDTAAGPNAPEAVTLTTPEATFAEGFTALTAVHELPDGRVLALDSRERTLQIIDLAAKTSTTVGRRGSGPGEYSLPIALLPLRADTIGVVDEAKQRVLLLAPNGRPAGVMALEYPFLAGPGAVQELTSDTLGHLYLPGMEFASTPNGLVKHDSMPVIRWSPGERTADTLAWFRRQELTVEGSRDGSAAMIGFITLPLVARDVWTVGRDGRVVVARPENYELRWTDANGYPTANGRGYVPFEPLPLSEAHKEEWRESQRHQGGLNIDGDGIVTMLPPDGKEPDDPPSWPESLAPFLGGALRFDATGHLWVRRTTAAGAPPIYDVVDPQGQLVRKVTLPLRSHIVGFGTNDAIYVVHRNDDDVQFLQRFRGTP
jgi:hypothetical protein